MCRASGLLHDHAAREVAGQVPQLVLQHLLGVPPALIFPEEVHADALHDDREQQRADQHPEKPERQGDGADDQSMPTVLLALRRGGGIAHGVASSPVALPEPVVVGVPGTTSSSRSSGKAASCKAGELVKSHHWVASV
ncbi:hypothetical protein SDC9_136389 [bioreactor metagenome]|uniref:Uncharacterized protein n=1 Tax=bioreactor metagenome TaxID=1076179 RepID=A0A645DJ55_9ZZZZ